MDQRDSEEIKAAIEQGLSALDRGAESLDRIAKRGLSTIAGLFGGGALTLPAYIATVMFPVLSFTVIGPICFIVGGTGTILYLNRHKISHALKLENAIREARILLELQRELPSNTPSYVEDSMWRKFLKIVTGEDAPPSLPPSSPPNPRQLGGPPAGGG